ncbi:hypothetical protein HDU91_000268, partial [Kappamyces sp. JEL0680]
ILQLRSASPGVTEHKFPLPRGCPGWMRFYDVSGLKHHRKQWISYFMEVHAILFVASVICYDQYMAEDKNTNRMDDALKAGRATFQLIANHPLLVKPTLILFLNKKDLLAEKMKKKSIATYFPGFVVGKKGPVESAVSFFKSKFIDQIHKPKLNAIGRLPDANRGVTVHGTSCTDTKGMKMMMPKILEGIMASKLQDAVLQSEAAKNGDRTPHLRFHRRFYQRISTLRMNSFANERTEKPGKVSRRKGVKRAKNAKDPENASAIDGIQHVAAVEEMNDWQARPALLDENGVEREVSVSSSPEVETDIQMQEIQDFRPPEFLRPTSLEFLAAAPKVDARPDIPVPGLATFPATDETWLGKVNGAVKPDKTTARLEDTVSLRQQVQGLKEMLLAEQAKYLKAEGERKSLEAALTTERCHWEQQRLGYKSSYDLLVEQQRQDFIDWQRATEAVKNEAARWEAKAKALEAARLELLEQLTGKMAQVAELENTVEQKEVVVKELSEKLGSPLYLESIPLEEYITPSMAPSRQPTPRLDSFSFPLPLQKDALSMSGSLSQQGMAAFAHSRRDSSTSLLSMTSDAPLPSTRTSSLHRLRLALPSGVEPVNTNTIHGATTDKERQLCKALFLLQQQNLKLQMDLERCRQHMK